MLTGVGYSTARGASSAATRAGLVNRRGDDDADADGHGTQQDGEGGVVFLHDFFPEMVGRDFIDDKEGDDEDSDPDCGVENRVDDVG